MYWLFQISFMPVCNVFLNFFNYNSLVQINIVKIFFLIVTDDFFV
jgi:hypothetical protein